MIAILIAALCVLIVVLIAVLVGAADTVHHHKTDAAHYRQLYDDAASITPNRIGCSILTLLGVMFFLALTEFHARFNTNASQWVWTPHQRMKWMRRYEKWNWAGGRKGRS